MVLTARNQCDLWNGRSRRRGTAKKLSILDKVMCEIRETVGALRAESGGIIGGDLRDGVVQHYYFDTTAHQSRATYSPDHNFLNRLLKENWNPKGIRLLGFVHSHPGNLARPSAGDMHYAQAILEHNDELEFLLLPIVLTIPDTGQFQFIPYCVTRDGDDFRLEKMDLVVLGAKRKDRVIRDIPATTVPSPSHELCDAVLDQDSTPLYKNLPRVSFGLGNGEVPLGETFRRVMGAYDLGRLASSRVLCVGIGGARAFVEELARTGVAEFVLIDPDVVAESNVATQQVYRRELGRPKVDCLAEIIRDINPHAFVVARQDSLDDIEDAEFSRLAHAPLREWNVAATAIWGLPDVAVPVRVSIRPSLTLICGLTDSFEAQARINRLALHFGLPSLCAQVYEEGRGGEITFTYPGVTPACHRCALSGRYKAFLEQGFQNNVTSNGTPIFSTGRLNALKGTVAMALLHHGTGHPRWGDLLARIGNRNLVQIRMHPDLRLPAFERVFGGADQERILFDDVVWLPQQPDCPESGFPTCPDCGGTGDLRHSIGVFDDTRVMRK